MAVIPRASLGCFSSSFIEDERRKSKNDRIDAINGLNYIIEERERMKSIPVYLENEQKEGRDVGRVFFNDAILALFKSSQNVGMEIKITFLSDKAVLSINGAKVNLENGSVEMETAIDSTQDLEV